ncbi:cob(I)yrinic acid a,c-diamide adenosyltransferase [Calderihabitans maritimus]|nr:cob(I)yrinic acid a,c-diamide adenosyltransferase [Calderihabitans maritimus]
MTKAKGLIQIYTGNGKGKTTAALGQALRAAGHGLRVYMLQFMKGSENYGEVKISSLLPTFTIVQSGRHEFVSKENPDPIDIELAEQGLRLAREAIFSGRYDMVILDEINVALDFGLIDLERIIEIIKNKPPELDLILTGRYAPLELYELADLVSEIRDVKHHYYKGVKAREGIEY